MKRYDKILSELEIAREYNTGVLLSEGEVFTVSDWIPIDDKWCHIVIQKDCFGTIKRYVNGKLVDPNKYK